MRRATSTLILFLFCFLPPAAAQEKKPVQPARKVAKQEQTGQEKKADKKDKVDPKVAAIEKAMAKVAASTKPVHFKFTISRHDPYEDVPQQVQGQFWAQGDEKLRLRMSIKVSGMKMEQEILVNSGGTWLRMPREGVIKYSPELMKKLKKLQQKGRGMTPSGSARSRLAILGGLRQQGFKLKWQEKSTLGKTEVEVIEGQRKKDARSPYDRCRILVGLKDRVPRQIIFYSDGEQLEKVEYSGIQVGGKIDPQVFEFKAKPGERVVDVLDTWMRQSIMSALESLEE